MEVDLHDKDLAADNKAEGSNHSSVNALANKLLKTLSSDLSMSPMCSIFKIPTILSRHNEKAFTPNAFSIGPFHRANDQLKLTQNIKSKYLLDLLNRLLNRNNLLVHHTTAPNTSLITALIRAIWEIKDKARDYYAGLPKDLNDDAFVEILLLDGCFIVELFRRISYPNLQDTKNDPIFTMSCLLQFLYNDLILLENQIPWLVLDVVFDQTKITCLDTKPLVELAIFFFGNTFPATSPPLTIQSIDPSFFFNYSNNHILDLFRNLLVFNSQITTQRSTKWEPISSASVLEDCGIRFMSNKHSKSILDITFNKKTGVMNIPTLFIQETTETLFRNLISLEQCCPNYEPIFTTYAMLLDSLIETNLDTEILCRNKAIVSWISIDEATKRLNELYVDTFVKGNYYHQLICDVNEYCGSRWHKYERVLKRDYCKHPWALISVLAASTIVSLAIVQTVFTIIK